MKIFPSLHHTSRKEERRKKRKEKIKSGRRRSLNRITRSIILPLHGIWLDPLDGRPSLHGSVPAWYRKYDTSWAECRRRRPPSRTSHDVSREKVFVVSGTEGQYLSTAEAISSPLFIRKKGPCGLYPAARIHGGGEGGGGLRNPRCKLATLLCNLCTCGHSTRR